MAVNFTHTDYTDELNRIITALTGIRNDIRLLRKVMEDPEQGAVTSNVLNDLQKAMLAVGLSNAGAANAEAVRKRLKDVGIGEEINAKMGKPSVGTSQENIEKIVQGAPPNDEVVDPSISDKRWPAVRGRNQTALPNANPFSDLFNPVTGELAGLTKDQQREQMIKSGTGGVTPPAQVGSSTNRNFTERKSILIKLGQQVEDDSTGPDKALIRVAGKYYFEVPPGGGKDDGRYGPIPEYTKFALGELLGYQAKTGTPDPETGENYGHDAEARSSLGSVPAINMSGGPS